MVEWLRLSMFWAPPALPIRLIPLPALLLMLPEMSKLISPGPNVESALNPERRDFRRMEHKCSRAGRLDFVGYELRATGLGRKAQQKAITNLSIS